MITLAFKKNSQGGLVDKIIEKAIQWKTNSKYFHVEMIIGEKWISSSPEVGAVYIHKLKPITDKNFDYVNIIIPTEKVIDMMYFAESQVGKEYDWKGIFLSQTIDMNIENKNKWFCSEIVSEMLKIGGIDLELPSNQYSPGDLYRIIAKEYNTYSV